MKNIILVILTVIFAVACQQQQEYPEETQEEIKAISVFAQTMQKKDLPEYIKISGTLEAKTDVVMISEVNGKLMKLHKTLGDWINKDETIGEVDSEIIKIQLQQTEAAVLSAEASYQTAQNNLTASEKLFASKTISQAEYDNAVTAEKGAKAQLDGAIAQKRQVEKMLENAMITAPVSGYISELPITLGNYISQGSILCRIVDSRTLLVKTGVGESVIKQMTKGQEVLLSSKTSNIDFYGKIKGFGYAPMLGSVNYPIEIEIKDNRNLLPGEIIEANILLQLFRDVFVIKQGALITEYDHDYIYLIDSENKIERKEIKVEKVIGDKLIISGVQVGDKIVANGTENVEIGSLVDIRKLIED